MIPGEKGPAPTNADGTRAARSARAVERREFYDALQRLLRIYQFRDRDIACYGDVSPDECYALEAIEADGALRVGDLAAALNLHKSNASRLARALEAKGYVARSTERGDGRAVSLRITRGAAPCMPRSGRASRPFTPRSSARTTRHPRRHGPAPEGAGGRGGRAGGRRRPGRRLRPTRRTRRRESEHVGKETTTVGDPRVRNDTASRCSRIAAD